MALGKGHMAKEQPAPKTPDPAAPVAAEPKLGPTPPAASDRGNRKRLVGRVVSAKMDKTRRVEVARLQKHAKYGKYLRMRTVCYVHDEKNESKKGDTVEIAETRPLSKTKRWRLVKVVAKAALAEDHVAAPA